MTHHISRKAHGVMFHHFHGGRQPGSQGSISADQLRVILDHVGRSSDLLSAHDWLSRFNEGRLEASHVCLTFDDSLKCQVEIAAPVLKERGLSAFFFVYSSVLEGMLEKLEIYRYIRNVTFAHIDDFYDEFEGRLLSSPLGSKATAALATFDPGVYLAPYSFYTERDKRYRFLRDFVLTSEEHEALMDEIVQANIPDPKELADLLWMTGFDVKKLNDDGDVIGLHSYSHPTFLARLAPVQQQREYQLNKLHLEQLTGAPVKTMSHPSNSYEPGTLEVLESLGIELGFRDNMLDGPYGRLEAPRIDHMDIWKMLA